jgi:Domain of unknown function (DUF932)
MFAARFTPRFASSMTQRAPMSAELLRRVAPSVFAEAAHDSRSERYAYIPTIDVLQALQREGFEVLSASQSRTRLADRREFTKHMLRLQHASQLGSMSGDSVPEIVLINSHDGSSSYKLMGGTFRFICHNGMIVPDGIVQTVKVQHSGNVRDKVAAGAFEVLDGLTRVVESRDAMRAVTLNDGEQRAFARAALALRFDTDEGQAAPVTPEQVNRARRLDDRAADLWTTFNRVQENVVRGGLAARSANGRRTSTRAVTGIDQDVKLNRALWTLAEEMRALKAGA